MSDNNDLSRRTFLAQSTQTAISAAAIAGLAATAGQAQAVEGDPLNVAVIGCGGMGGSHLKLLAGRQDVRVTWVSDVDDKRLAEAVGRAKSSGQKAPQTARDLRRVLDDPSVAAVWIATPDHWHAPAAILACQAGKHVYVEKPCSHNIREGRLMLEAARQHNRVMQVGTQSRSTAHVRAAIDRLRAGAIGEVLVAKAWNSQRRGSIGHQQPADPPSHLDFDLWLGPAPQRAYQSNLLPSIWRWWYDFGTGDIGNDGVHDIDIARWGLGVATHPSRVAALGGKHFFDDDQQFPDTQYCVYEYPASGGRTRQLVFEQRIWSPYVQEGYENGNAFYGTEGLLILGKHGGWKLFGPRNKLVEEMSGEVDLAAHHQNFLDCIASGARPNADIEVGHLSASLAHLGNIACRVGRQLEFDPANETVLGDDAAAALVHRTYRPGHWAVPAGV